MMNFEISHAVDDSDVAFVLRLDRKSTVCSMMSSRSTLYHKVGTNIDAFVNLATVNYLLAGLQLCYSRSSNTQSKWFELLHDLDQYRYPQPGVQLSLWDMRMITRELIVPFGVVRGSEKQGGQDETGMSPATYPVNFVSNLVLDGHERNVVNYWHYHDVSAGDDLVFRLKAMPIPKGRNAYTLNHYYKRFVQQNFESYFQQNLGHPFATHVWQLVPDIFTLDYKPENDVTHDTSCSVRMSPGFEVPKDYVWQEHGFWHIGRSQVMFRKYALKEYYNDDMANQLKVNHLDMTFEPTYTKVPGEDLRSQRIIFRDKRPHADMVPSDRSILVPRADDGFIKPGMRGSAAGPGVWVPELVLEGAGLADFISAPMPRLQGNVLGPPLSANQAHELDVALSGMAGMASFPSRAPVHELDMAMSDSGPSTAWHELNAPVHADQQHLSSAYAAPSHFDWPMSSETEELGSRPGSFRGLGGLGGFGAEGPAPLPSLPSVTEEPIDLVFSDPLPPPANESTQAAMIGQPAGQSNASGRQVSTSENMTSALRSLMSVRHKKPKLKDSHVSFAEPAPPAP